MSVDFSTGDSPEKRIIIALEIIDAYYRKVIPGTRASTVLSDIDMILRQTPIKVALR